MLFPTEPAVFPSVFIPCLLLMVGCRMLVLIADCICQWKLNVVGYRLSSADCRLSWCLLVPGCRVLIVCISYRLVFPLSVPTSELID